MQLFRGETECLQDLSLKCQENKSDRLLCYHDFYYAKAGIHSKDRQKSDHFWGDFPAPGLQCFCAVVFFFPVILIVIAGKLNCRWLGVACG